MLIYTIIFSLITATTCYVCPEIEQAPKVVATGYVAGAIVYLLLS